MRKTQIIGFIALFLIFLAYGSADAQIAGQCVNCHTMHNSQNGVPVNDEGPFPQLLNAECIACHTGPIVANGRNVLNAPVVLNTTDPGGQGEGSTLAGGDFWWVTQTATYGDAYGHNVSGVAAIDVAISANIGNNPPGWDPSATSGFAFGQVAGGEANWGSQLSCDGIYGCHGMHSATGVTGAHHANTGGTSNQCSTADTVGNSYRFLGGIKGLENGGWNWSEDASTHNEYYGVNSPADRGQTSTTYANKDTISFSCAECHGYFHSRIDDTTTGSPWLRHPTDIVLPATGEYADYNPDEAGVYSVEAPVARPTVPESSSSTVTPGADIVMCLSCHRAHGSPVADLMRWAYPDDTQRAGEGTDDIGCFRCHTTKNAD
jgi:hypothetical protein